MYMEKNDVLQFKSSRCISSEGQTISKCLVYEPFHVEVVVENTLRGRPVTNVLRVTMYRDVTFGLDEMLKAETRILTVSPMEAKTVVVSFLPIQESSYYYTVHIGDEMINTRLYSNRLSVSRKETILFLEEPPSSVSEGETVIFKGRLLSAHYGENITGAKIHIHHNDVSGDKLMASGITKNDGAFNIMWKAQKLDWMHYSGEVYAKFEGDDLYKPSRSDRFIINVIRK